MQDAGTSNVSAQGLDRALWQFSKEHSVTLPESEHLETDALRLPPFDVDRLLQDTQALWEDNPRRAVTHAALADGNEPASDVPSQNATPPPQATAIQGNYPAIAIFVK